MEQWQKERLEKIEEKLRQVIRSAAQNYISGSSSAVWETIEDSLAGNGCYKIRMWPGNALIDLTYVCNDLRYQDTGDTIACFATDYFGFLTIAKMIMNTIDTLDNGE